MRRISLVLFGWAAVTALALSGCGSSAAEGKADESTPVRLADVKVEEVALPVRVSGRLIASDEATLSFKTGGIVGKVLVDEGRSVKKGQTIARLQMTEIDAQVAQARSGFEKASRDYERVSRLYDDKVATLEQKQNAETALTMAKAAKEVAEFNQAHSEITAPSDGRVLKKYVESNELVGAGRPIVLFGSPGRAWLVRAGVSDRDMVRLNLGDSATVRLDAWPERELKAEVTEIAEAADPRTGTYTVEMQLEPSDCRLASGFVAKVEIHPAQTTRYSILPAASLLEADGRTGVVFAYDREAGCARRREVNLGPVMTDRIAVIDGLEDVRQVIAEGSAYLTDGQPVRPVD